MVAHVAHATMFLMLIGTVLAILFALITAVIVNLRRSHGLSRAAVAAALIIIAAALIIAATLVIVIAAAALVIIGTTLIIAAAALVIIVVRSRGNGRIVGKEWIRIADSNWQDNIALI